MSRITATVAVPVCISERPPPTVNEAAEAEMLLSGAGPLPALPPEEVVRPRLRPGLAGVARLRDVPAATSPRLLATPGVIVGLQPRRSESILV